MGKKASGDQLYLLAESLAQDFSLFPKRPGAAYVKGLISDRDIEIQLERLRNMDVDSYVEATIHPVEEPSRPGAREIIKSFDLPIVHEIESGPFYAAELEMDFEGTSRRVGFITQNREVNSGIWMPEHHALAAQTASDFAIRSLPIVNFMDTPGADAGEEANNRNQAHSISALIAELCNVDVPTLGIIIGQGYSGGAIPLAASNLLLSTRTSVFNTIHPKGLANLNRRHNLSWQECAKFVGIDFQLLPAVLAGNEARHHARVGRDRRVGDDGDARVRRRIGCEVGKDMDMGVPGPNQHQFLHFPTTRFSRVFHHTDGYIFFRPPMQRPPRTVAILGSPEAG